MVLTVTRPSERFPALASHSIIASDELVIDLERLAQMNGADELAFGGGQFVCVDRETHLVNSGKAISKVSLRWLSYILCTFTTTLVP